MKATSTSPIGIFDSGIGGLTVAKSVIEALPDEDIIYFGDTARVPYGIKSEETVRDYALQITDFLLRKEVKMILVACNTVSASAKKQIIERAGDIPVLDVISAGTAAALQKKNQKKIGVIGTLATVHSGAYRHSVTEAAPETEVLQQACPLLVPLAEEGWTNNNVAMETLKNYLQVFDGSGIESLILGCTHYPLFKESIAEVMNDENLTIIDSAESIAASARALLKQSSMLNEQGGSFECYVSDRPQRFHDLAERFLGRDIDGVHVVKLN